MFEDWSDIKLIMAGMGAIIGLLIGIVMRMDINNKSE